MKHFRNFLVATALFVPFISYGGYFDGGVAGGGIDGFFMNVSGFINNILIPFVFGLALLLFIWGMYRWFIQGGANEGDREKGKQLTLYAVIGFVLMVSIWAIVNLISGGLFSEDERNIQRNQIPQGINLEGDAGPGLAEPTVENPWGDVGVEL